MPPKTPYPTPTLRWHNGAWKIVWNWGGKQYSVSTGLSESDKLFAEKRRIDFALALRKDIPDFPDEFKYAKSVVEYCNKRYESGQTVTEGSKPGQWIDAYAEEIKGKNTAEWVRDTKRVLKRLRDSAGGLEKVTEQKASAFMSDRAAKKSYGTHNRNLTVYKKFYAWLVNTKRHGTNPFAHIKRLNERKDTPIVYCTAKDRDSLIELAKALGETGGWPEWMAVPVAFYTGMRREEIANLRWDDINFTSGAINVVKTKTRTSRTLPLNSKLEALLTQTPEQQRFGYVIQCPDGADRVWRMHSLTNKLKKSMKETLLSGWEIKRPPPSKAKDYKEKKEEYQATVAKRKDAIAAALARTGWNAWRHTFASLLVQAGVNIDTIASWLGNNPEVCRRHYAQFIPRDKRDSRIDMI